MNRKALLAEISRENKTRRRVFPRWIQIKKLDKNIAERRLKCTELMEAVFEVMSDDEFQQLVNRLEIKPSHEQGNLF